MSSIVAPAQGPGVGLWLSEIDTVCMLRGGNGTKGDVMALDTTDTDAGTTAQITTALAESVRGTEIWVFGNVIVPVTATLPPVLSGAVSQATLFCVLMENALDDTRVRVRFSGFVQALCASATLAGDAMVAANAVRSLTKTVTAGNKILAIAESTDAATATQKPFLFNGIQGFGQVFAS